MSGTLSLREAALATVTARLVAQLPDVVVERARRSPVDADADPLPLLVITGEDLHADDSVEPGATHYRVGFLVSGYARASTDLGAEQALSHLHARVVGALDRVSFVTFNSESSFLAVAAAVRNFIYACTQVIAGRSDVLPDATVTIRAGHREAL